MNDLIYRQDAIRKYCYESCGCDTKCGTEGCPMTFDRDGAEECYFIRFLKELPSVQPEQKTGRWKMTPTYYPYCSECEWMPEEDEMVGLLYNFCPNCGAKMKGDDT